MIGYIVSIGLLYLFLRFQLDKIHDPNQPKKLKSYSKWIEDTKNSCLEKKLVSNQNNN